MLTRTAGVVGWPVEQSRSPLIHRHWLKRHGIDGDYIKVAIESADFADFLRRLPEYGLVGGNATVPHKEQLATLADELSDVARSIGAANTFWCDGNRLIATNTDAYGFMAHLMASAPEWNLRDDPAIVLGAGGAARAIIYALLEAGVERIDLLNRTRGRAEALARQFGPRVRAHGLDGLVRHADDAMLLVNTTTVGMTSVGSAGAGGTTGSGAVFSSAVSRLRGDSTVVDIVYSPLETELLAAARARHLSVVDGLGMLLHQAVPGFEAWFGVRPEVDAELRALVVADLKGDNH